MLQPSDLHVLRFPTSWGGLVACSHRGLQRESNQDRFGASEIDARTFALADGMGGHSNGELAADLAVKAACHRPDVTRATAEAVVDAAIDAARRAVAPLEAGRRGTDAPGCTLVVARIGPQRRAVRVGWVGDSRAYLFTGGILTPITQDHALGGRLTRSIGGGAPATPADAVTVAVDPSRWLLLCSDGLHGFVSDAEIAACLSGAGGREHALRRLVDAAFAKKAPDNITCMIASFA